MAQYEDGAYIPLYWEGDEPAHYVKGWHTEEHIIKELTEQEVIENASQIDEFKKTYARWNIGRDELGDPMSFLQTKDQPGKGRFQVTEITLKALSK